MSPKQIPPLSQPGLEVAPESQLPEVVNGPVVFPQRPDPFLRVPLSPPRIALSPPVPPKESPPVPEKGRWDTPESWLNRSVNWVAPVSAFSDYSPVSETGSLHFGSRFPRTGRSLPAAHATHGNRTFSILGGSRKKFWLVFGPIFAFIAVGLAVGLSLGLSIDIRDEAEDASDQDSTLRTATTSTAASPTASVLVIPTMPLMCPEANGTTYQPVIDKDSFLILCDVDYDTDSTAAAMIDVDITGLRSVEECIAMCANYSVCVGAGWGNREGRDACWMKGSLGSSKKAPNWFFAIRKNSSDPGV
ncbi:hypothetical protein DL766_008156 [Monosporascus sp. MC13-8B]|uniref:Apple domain-containing protein n=1 Tax=Monosporascus cannonballus TaxID=155416 RepID=A0ABY0GR07_9PEZI|nr:hypothetical protein DL762_010278 [Monosporascus cannonballus]RYO81457.1 hypothetical protein DL763_008584 [Monosporascus cannonballus]RYP20605.1 hypothetical protein DL766_008156 [Monosporascus sp. MC13-8B]